MEDLEVLRSWFKGSDTTTLNKFLEWKLGQELEGLSPPDGDYFKEMLTLVKFGNRFMSTLYHSSLWISNKRRAILISTGDGMVASFLKLAQEAYNRDLSRWKLQTKFHMLGEVIFSFKHDRTRGCCTLNPLSYATQQDEDFVGRISTMSRSVSSRTLHEKTIRRYMLKLKALWSP